MDKEVQQTEQMGYVRIEASRDNKQEWMARVQIMRISQQFQPN
jgi:hypothetical protein